MIYKNGVLIQDLLRDADGDTKIQVEESADEDKIRMDVAGVEAFLLSDVGILTLAKQSSALIYANIDQQLPASAAYYAKVIFNLHSYDQQNEMNYASRTGTATATTANKLEDSGESFTSADLDAEVYNTTDKTYATVTNVDSGTVLSLSADIMADTEGYRLYHSKFTCKELGKYLLTARIQVLGLASTDQVDWGIYKNGALTWVTYDITNGGVAQIIIPVNLVANDYLEPYVKQHNAATKVTNYGLSPCYFALQRL